MKKFKNIELLYMDTDSFIIKTPNENFGKIMYEYKEYFDLSNLPKDCIYYCGDKNKVPGKMKDEYAGKVIFEFSSSKPKSYTIIDVNNNEKSVNKGHISNIRVMILKM